MTFAVSASMAGQSVSLDSSAVQRNWFMWSRRAHIPYAHLSPRVMHGVLIAVKIFIHDLDVQYLRLLSAVSQCIVAKIVYTYTNAMVNSACFCLSNTSLYSMDGIRISCAGSLCLASSLRGFFPLAFCSPIGYNWQYCAFD